MKQPRELGPPDSCELSDDPSAPQEAAKVMKITQSRSRQRGVPTEGCRVGPGLHAVQFTAKKTVLHRVPLAWH